MKSRFTILKTIALAIPVYSKLGALLLLLVFFFDAQQVNAQFSGGSGTVADPYQITTINQLQIISNYNTAHFKIMNDIDASVTSSWNGGAGFVPLSWFGGTLDGSNFKISGLVIIRSNSANQALFTNLGATSAIRNLQLLNVNIKGQDNAASLAAQTSGIVENVTVTGSVTGRGVIGGLISTVNSSAIISNCHASSITVTGANQNNRHQIGGLIAVSGGAVSSCTASGSVSGRGTVGGLIGQVNTTGSLVDSHADNVTVTAFNTVAGGLVGYYQGVNFENNTSSGVVSGVSQIGGLTGRTDTPVASSHSSASVNGTNTDIGGLIGWINNTMVSNCYSTGSVNGYNRTGGLVGYMSSQSAGISYCHTSSSVQGNDDVGGLLGYNNNGLIEKSYSTGSVAGRSRIGGLIGFNAWEYSVVRICFSVSDVTASSEIAGGLIGRQASGTVENTYARGSVSGPNKIGGHTGEQADGLISKSYSTGFITSAGSQVGGFMGNKTGGTVSNSFWDLQTSGKTTSVAGTAKTTAEMLDINTFLAAGWDFESIWAIQDDINDGYPYFDDFYSLYVNTWTGAIDRQWELGGNWSANYLPLPHQNVVIPNVPNQPVISSTVLINGLNIQAGSSVTVSSAGKLKISNTLTNSNGPEGLVVESNVTGTGSLIHNSNNVNGTIQRYLPAAGYHLASVPLTQASNPMSVLFLWSYLYEYDVPGQKWVGLGSPTNTPLFSDKGYMIWKYPGPTSWQPDTTYSFAGPMNNGAFSYNISYPAFLGNHNLAGNPYPSPIDWNALGGWTKTDVSGSYWMWIHSSNNYGVWNGIVGTQGVTKDIPVGQGFFVQALSANATLEVNNNARIHSDQAFYKDQEEFENILRMKALANNYSDEIIVLFDESSTPGFDSWSDATKMSGLAGAPQLYTLLDDDTRLTINTMPYSRAIIEIPLAFTMSVAGEVVFEASSIESFEPQASIQLLDMLSGIITDLRTNPNFTFIHNPENDPVRFKLIFNGLTSVPETSISAAELFFCDNYIHLRIPENIPRTTPFYFYDATGRMIFSTNVKSGYSTIMLPGAVSGIYIAHLIFEDRTVVKKVLVK